MLLNLISNAIHACAASDVDLPILMIRTGDVEDGVVLEVEDMGVGIDDEAREHVFTPFFTTKPPGDGTGLGLFISRRIVEELGGTIDFRDRPGGGTIFRVRLPSAPPDAPSDS